MRILLSLKTLFSYDHDAEYRQFYFKTDYTQAVISIGFLLTPITFFIYSDYVLLKFTTPFYFLFSIRSTMIVLTIATVFFYRKKSNYKLFDFHVLALCLLGAFLAFAAALTRPVTYTHSYVFDIVAIMAFYLVIPNRLSFRILSGFIYSLLTGYIFVFVKVHTSPLVIHTTIICFFLINVFGTIIAKRMCQYRYKQYKTQIEDEKLKKELAKSNEELKNMAHILAHDLKSPLVSVISNISLLMEYAEIKEPHIDFCTNGLSSARSMCKFIDDLLAFSTVDKNAIFTETVKLKKVFDWILNNLTQDIYKNQIRIQIGEMPVIRGSYTLFTLLFQNLIQNAIKYRKEKDSFIRVDFELVDNIAVFRVQDNGIGIPEKDKERVFNLFYKAHHHNEKMGSGIGLSTCKKIVEMYHGKIFVESGENQGTTFILSFPGLKIIDYLS